MDKSCLPKTLLCETTGERLAIVYTITNSLTKEVYVGKTVAPRQRWATHRYAARNGSEALPHLYRNMRKHGIENFSFQVVSTHRTEEAAFDAEVNLIQELNRQNVSLLNVTGGGKGGTNTSPQTRAKMSQAHRARWADPIVRRRQIDQLKLIWSDPQLRQAHSEIQQTWSRTPEARAKNSAAQLRPEVRHAKSEAMKERWETDVELRERHQQSITAEDVLQRQSERQTSAWNDPIQRQRLLEGMNRSEVKQARRERLSFEGNPRAKLNWAIVEQVRTAFENHGSMEELCKEFPQVSYGTLRRVVTKRVWVKS